MRAVEAASDGSVWLSVRGRGVVRIANGEVDWMTVEDGLVSNGIADLHEDGLGRIWAAGLDGYSVFDGGRWVAHRAFGGLAPRVVFRVSEDAATGSIWLAANGGAGRLASGAWRVLRPSDGLPHQVVHAVVVDRDGVVWLACRAGLARVERGEVRVLFPEVNFRAALAGPDGSLWFGTSDGVYRWDGSSWGRDLEWTVVSPVLVARDGAVWVGSAASGLFRHAAGRWESIDVPDRLRGVEIFDLSEAPDGSISLATAAGAAHLRVR